jgi:hypothetical protein
MTNSNDRNPYNPSVTDVQSAFAGLPADGEDHTYNGSWAGNPFLSHVQGVAAYKHYLILTHNNRGFSRGDICVVDRDKQDLMYKFETPDEHFNHPGGCQQIGDFLAVAIENSDYAASRIHFYDLSVMTDTKRPQILPNRIVREHHGAGGVGITNFRDESGVEKYVLVTYDNGTVDFYQSNGYPLGHPSLDFAKQELQDKMAIEDYSEICLVTEMNLAQQQRLYLMGFRTDLGIINAKDYAHLYQLDQSNGIFSISQRINERHLYTHYRGFPWVGVHFRYGAGLQIRSDRTMEIYATQRNFDGTMQINTFRRSSALPK